jgi:cytochrome P450
MTTYTDIRRLWRLLAPARIKQARLRHENYVRTNAQEYLDNGVIEERKDFLSYILRNRDGRDGLTDKEVAANCGFLIIMGSGAAGTAMSSILFHLLRAPSALQTMTNEVRDAFSGKAEIKSVNASTCLPYHMACISEGMRIYLPGPAIPLRRNPKGGMNNVPGYQMPDWVSFKFLRQVSNKEEMSRC